MAELLLVEKDRSVVEFIRCFIPSWVSVRYHESELSDNVPNCVVFGPNITAVEINTNICRFREISPSFYFAAFRRSGSGSVEAAEVLSAGVNELLVYPEDARRLPAILETPAIKRLCSSNTYYREPPLMKKLIGDSDSLRQIKRLIVKYSSYDAPVLITGESGTGKELAASLIHELSPRSGRIFHAINSGAIPAGLKETELFGSERGAYTGAVGGPGCFEYADGGTLFLDEIGELGMDLQVELLRVLETGKVKRVGSNVFRSVNVRLVSATNRNLCESVRLNAFRMDLFYRINTFCLDMPPLRARREDIPQLAAWFVAEQNRKSDEKDTRQFVLTDRSLDKLISYEWPGNIRELKNVMLRACCFSDDYIIRAENIVFY